MGNCKVLKRTGVILAATALLFTGVGTESIYANEEKLPPGEKEFTKAWQENQWELENWSNKIDTAAVKQALEDYYGSEKMAKVAGKKKDVPGAILVTPNSGDGSGKIVGHSGIFSKDIFKSVEAFPGDGVIITSSDWNQKYKKFKKFYVSKSDKNQYDQAAKFARNQLGKPYSLLTNKSSTDKYYCSKLVWKSWRLQGKYLDKDGGYWVFPSDISGDKDVVAYYSK